MVFFDQYFGFGFFVVVGLGLFLGSFFNVVILCLFKWLDWQWKCDVCEVLEELDIYELLLLGIVVELLYCLYCKYKLVWYENILLFSWLVQCGKCCYCYVLILIQYLLVEVLIVLLVVVSVWQFGFGWQGFGVIVLICFLIILLGIDLCIQLLLDQLILLLMWLGLIVVSDNLYMLVKLVLFGVLVGYLLLWLVWWLFKQFIGKEGMGYGDFKLLVVLGVWCGFKGILLIILLLLVVGVIIGLIWLYLCGCDCVSLILFGLYLVIVGWIVFFWGELLINGYLSYVGLC